MKLRRLKLFLVFLVILLVFFSLNKFGINKIRNTIFRVSSPIQEAFWQVGKKLSLTLQVLFEIKELKKETEEVKKMNLRFQHQIIALREIARENKVLRKALNLDLQKPFNLTLANVVSKTTEGDFILINQGKKEGLSQGMPVITAEKILVGRIEKVFDDFSQVSLISNPKITFDIEVLDENEKFLGIAKGKGNLRIQFQFIDKKAQIKKGDTVVSSRLAGNFPPGLLVGTIKTIKKSDVEPFLEGEINPYFKELDIEILFVIKEF
ncbi:rod shape-determining protein MreC [bacterium]|nr:rod shape-determining protein MreC [bacterium]